MNDQQPVKRCDVQPENTWNLQDLCESDAVFEQQRQEVQELLPEISSYQGRLAEGAAVLLEFIQLTEKAEQRFDTLYVYANMHLHEDMNVTLYQGYTAQMQTLAAQLSAAESFFESELLSLPEEQLRSYTEDASLRQYRLLLERILRRKAHTLSASEEAILARSLEMSSAADDIFSMLNDADLKFGEITDADGQKKELTIERYVGFMESPDRNVRKEAFQKLYAAYGQFKNTIGTAYTANIKKARFYSEVRRYDSTLEQCLTANEIPLEVYDQLIETVNANLPKMHRYVSLRKKVLGLEEHHLYDNYAPLVPDYQREFSFEEAKELARKALAVMGEDYLRRLEEGFSNRWIDVYENIGKCSGAYSWGAYGTHPYVLLNYQGHLNDVFTLVHEMGHALHSMYSNEAQPYTYAGYRIFVAEVASTCNEALLMRYMLSQSKDRQERAYLINHFLDQFKGTLYRQTMFAEFEKTAHSLYAQGEALTPDRLCEIYRELNAKYFGEDMVIDEEIALEWMRIPHFYSEFYVYQYATGFSAAIALSNRILKEGAPAVADYIRFLSGGSSASPIELLKIAGVDMTSPQPVQDALDLFGELIEELEGLL
ncbi:MAG: oligoendopeptidase F [Ruminococcus sp.]|nr:oligoendopeptidase F [Ruminococcus sp.]